MDHRGFTENVAIHLCYADDVDIKFNINHNIIINNNNNKNNVTIVMTKVIPQDHDRQNAHPVTIMPC